MKNKNLLFGIIIGVVLIGLFIATFFVKKDYSGILTDDPDIIMENLDKESSSIKEDEQGDFAKDIDLNEYMEIYNTKDEYQLVFVGRPGCIYCMKVDPLIKKLIKKHSIYISYLNIDNFSKEDLNTFVSTDKNFEDLGTPMLLVVGDSKVLDLVDGATDYAHYEDFLKRYKFIKE